MGENVFLNENKTSQLLCETFKLEKRLNISHDIFKLKTNYIGMIFLLSVDRISSFNMSKFVMLKYIILFYSLMVQFGMFLCVQNITQYLIKRTGGGERYLCTKIQAEPTRRTMFGPWKAQVLTIQRTKGATGQASCPRGLPLFSSISHLNN